MSIIAVFGTKQAPGASTLALALAAVQRHAEPLVVETDPHGGDLATRAGLTLEPGLLTLAAAGRHSINGAMLQAHTQALPNGVRALPEPTDPSQLHAALSLVAEPLRNALTARSGTTILDAGRWVPASAATPLTDAASTIVVVFRPDVTGIEQLRVRLASLPVGRTLPVAVGDRPYRPTEIAAAAAASGSPGGSARPEGRRRRGRRRSARPLVAAQHLRALHAGAGGTAARSSGTGGASVTIASDVLDERLVQQVRARVGAELIEHNRTAELHGQRRLSPDDERALARQLVNRALEALAREAVTTGRPVLDDAAEQALSRAVFDRIFQLGRLQPLLDDERITNILANGHDRVFVEYADGTKLQHDRIADSDAELIDLLREIGRRYGLSEREVQPGSTVAQPAAAGWEPPLRCRLGGDRPAVAIRRHRFLRVSLDDLQGLGALDAEVAGLLSAAVRARKQIIISRRHRRREDDHAASPRRRDPRRRTDHHHRDRARARPRPLSRPPPRRGRTRGPRRKRRRGGPGDRRRAGHA
ncbi:MAG: hypothetical protein R2755_26355 [Acidimicrobiales bacterium]